MIFSVCLQGKGLFINANILCAVHPEKDNAIFISLVSDAHLFYDVVIQQQYNTPLITAEDIPFVHFTKQEVWHQDAAVCMNAYSLYKEKILWI